MIGGGTMSVGGRGVTVTGVGSTMATLPFGGVAAIFCVGVATFCVGEVSVRRWRSVGVAGWLHGQVGAVEANAVDAASVIDRPVARSSRRLAVRPKSLPPELGRKSWEDATVFVGKALDQAILTPRRR